MNAKPKNLRRLLASLMLGVLLILGQQHAARHWLEDAVKAARAEGKSAPAKIHCAECDGLVALGAGMPAPAVAMMMLPLPTRATPLAALLPGRTAAAIPAYSSRAPPIAG